MLLLLAGLAHNPEPGDPVLLDWIMDRIDAILGLNAEAIVIALGAVIVLVPLAIMALFVIQRARQGRG